jgi:hypothetical protein
MAYHPDTWASIIKMARARFSGDEPAAQTFTRETYDAEETTAYAVAQDAEDEQQVVLEAARGAAQLCAELDSAVDGRSSRTVAMWRRRRHLRRIVGRATASSPRSGRGRDSE